MRFLISWLAAMWLAALCALPANAQTTRIESHCLGNAFESCFLLIEGQITPGLMARLEGVMAKGVDGRLVFLNSPGGNLGEAIKLGRWFRENGFHTAIGGSEGVPERADGTLAFAGREFPGGGRCESACAYAFMGGVERLWENGDRLGFHRFSAPGQAISASDAQVISGQLITYMVEMGIDARLFLVAAGQNAAQMYHVTDAEARAFDLVTPYGYDAFFLEPYRNGVLAATKRLDTPGPYDAVDQMTLFCRGGAAFAVLHAVGQGLQTGDTAPVWVTLDGDGVDLGAGALSVRAADRDIYLTIALPAGVAARMANARQLYVGADFPRVVGGTYGATHAPTDMDRAMIRAAFTHCID